MSQTNRRAQWESIPVGVRATIEAELAGEVVAVHPKVGGFTAGMASVVSTDTSQAFVKAIPLTDGQAASYRREAENVVRLPDAVPVPRLLFSIETEGWVVLGFEAIEGATLSPTMSRAEAEHVVRDVAQFQRHLRPSPIEGLRTFSEVFNFSSWTELASEGRSGSLTVTMLPPKLRSQLDGLRRMEAHSAQAVLGDTLLHLDLRHDNIVKDSAGKNWFVDWSWLAVGAPWVDVVSFLATCEGSLNREQAFQQYEARQSTAAKDVDAFLVGLMGYWLTNSTLAVPDNAPHLRSYQRRCAERTGAWLSERGHDLEFTMSNKDLAEPHPRL